MFHRGRNLNLTLISPSRPRITVILTDIIIIYISGLKPILRRKGTYWLHIPIRIAIYIYPGIHHMHLASRLTNYAIINPS